VAGFGPVGRRVTRHLEQVGFRCTVIELNPATVRNESESGRSVVFGSIANADVLDSAGIDHADLLVITMLDEDSAAHAAALARRRNSGVFIAARVGLASHVEMLQRAGVDHVLADESAAADAMMHALTERAALAAALPKPAATPHEGESMKDSGE
jgi:CPA2 family monovalent cation:H+ antiporter-2